MSEKGKSGFSYGYVIVAATFIMMVVGWGTYYSYGIFFESLLAEFGWTRALTSGAFSISLLVYGLMSIIAGRLSDQLGSRKVCTACCLILGLGYLLMSQVNAIWQVYLLYIALIAVGMSSFWTPLVSIVARWFVERRGIMTGIVVCGIGVGSFVIIIMISQLISIYDWRITYIIIGVITLAVAVVAAQFLRCAPSQQMEQLSSREGSIPKAKDYSFREAIGTSQFWMLCAIYFCYGVSLLSVRVHIVSHAIGLGISASTAANILGAIGGTSIISRLLVGGATDKLGVKSSLVSSLVLQSIAGFFLLVAREVWMFYLFSTLFGFAYGGMSAVQSLTVAELFGLSAVGVIIGSVALSFTLGGAIGPVISGHIFDTTSSYSLAFLICAIMTTVGFILALLLKPVRSKGKMPGEGGL